MPAEPNPTLARAVLASQLRAHRLSGRRELVDLAGFLGVTVAQASRLDTGARGFKSADVRKLADWYGISDAERDRFLALAAESRRRGWWQQVDLPDSYRTLIGLEQSATSIREYCSSVVPGLLQTRDYARAAIRGSVLDLDAGQIESAIDTRMRRQDVLRRRRPPELVVVLDEAVLARVTGGPQVMRKQLEHLISASEDLHIDVQVIAFEMGAHPGGESHFIMVDVDADIPGTVYIEGFSGASDMNSISEVARYDTLWSHLRGVALDPRASRVRLAQYVAGLGD